MEAWLEPIYDAAGMRAADAWAIEEQQVPSTIEDATVLDKLRPILRA